MNYTGRYSEDKVENAYPVCYVAWVIAADERCVSRTTILRTLDPLGRFIQRLLGMRVDLTFRDDCA